MAGPLARASPAGRCAAYRRPRAAAARHVRRTARPARPAPRRPATERNGRTRLPSLDGALGKQHDHLALARGGARSPRSPRRWPSGARGRGTCSAAASAKSPITGQPATSDFATNESGCSEPSTGMSSQETWLASTRVGRRPGRRPPRRTRTPNSREKEAVEPTGSRRAKGPSRRMLSACGPTARTKAALKTSSLAAAPIQVIGGRSRGCGHRARAPLPADTSSAPSRGVRLVRQRHRVEFEPMVDERDSRAAARSRPASASISSERNSMTSPVSRLMRWSWCSRAACS